MENELIESRAALSFHLDGESSIDASILAEMISDMVGLTKIVATEVNPDAYLKMNVTAFKNGSFQVDFSAVCQVVKTIFIAVGAIATTAGTVIGAVKGAIELKKLLKGEKPKTVTKNNDGTIEVESNSGDKVTVPAASQVAIYNIKADQFISHLSNCAQEHNPNGGFSIEDESGSVYCSSNDLKGMLRPAPIEESATCKKYVVHTDLRIRKPVLEGTSKWGFEMNGKAIDAAILDEAFLDWFSENGTVKRGDHIDARVEILIDLDPTGAPLRGTEKYTVVQVNGKIYHEMEQMSL